MDPSEYELRTVLRRIVDAAVDLVDAEYGALGVIGQQGGLIHTGMPQEVLRVTSRLSAAITDESNTAQFTEAERDLASDLADRVSLVIELLRTREAEERGLLFQERSRIARDLHDHVIQLLFGTGLELNRLTAGSRDAEQAAALDACTARIDEAIARIRSIVFAMTPTAEGGRSARHAIVDLATEASKALPNAVKVDFNGPVDIIVTDDLLNDVTAVAREMLANTVKHAHAETVTLTVTVLEDRLEVLVEDDGSGLGTSPQTGGIRNIRQRAKDRGGVVHLQSEPGWTSIAWTVPIT